MTTQTAQPAREIDVALRRKDAFTHVNRRVEIRFIAQRGKHAA